MATEFDPVLGTESDVLGRRVAAFVLDMAVVSGASVLLVSTGAGVAGALVAIGAERPGFADALGRVAGGTGPESMVALGMAAAGLVGTALLLAYFAGFEAWLGRTPGKMAMGLVVVDADGDPCDLRAAVVRNVLRAVDAAPTAYLLGLGTILATDRSQRVGDLAANTVVVRAHPPKSDESEAPTGSATAAG